MPNSAYQAGAQLGEMLGGGLESDGSTYTEQLTKNYNAQRTGYLRDKAMEDATFQRNINLARAAGIEQELRDLGHSPEQAALANRLSGFNQTFNMDQLGDYATPGYDEAIDGSRAAMATGDIPAYNRHIAQAQVKPYQPVRVAGGAYIEDGIGLGDIDTVPTLGTAATIEAKEARTRQGQERTDAYVNKTGRDGKPAKYAAPPEAALKSAFTVPGAGYGQPATFDNAGYNDFLLWRDENPHYNGVEALDRYRLERSGLGESGLQVIDPRKPGSMTIRPPAAAPPPVAGAKRAPDGNWYIQKDGQYFRVES